jgi:2,4-dienoyl-CoA reductase-like NADH-dependent reductase (Old Yellow Enzyme family)
VAEDCARLLEPLALGPMTLPNRIVSTAHQTNLVAEHLPTDDFIAYHEARARGGAGMIVLEAAAVHSSGLLTSKTLAAYLPESGPAFRRVADAMRPHGTCLLVQLFHGGREQIAVPPRAPVLAPSAIPSPRWRVEPRALDGREIEEIIDGYAAGARTAESAGLDGVEISAAHRYLIASFFDPALNRRRDEWSDARALLAHIIAAVRQAAPRLAVGLRISADAPHSAAIAQAAGDLIDYLHGTLGDASTLRGAAGIVPPPPVTHRSVIDAARGLPRAVPLILTGRFTEPEAADEAIRSGRADAVGMTRALITDAELPRKLRENRAEEVLRCIGCNACIAHYHDGTGIACTQNPRTGRERRMPRRRDGAARRIAIVGAGPAGLAAAAEAIAAGDSVVLFEQEDAVGGQTRLYRDAPGQRELGVTLARNYERVLASERLELRLGSRADAPTVADVRPDLVLLACGAQPFAPDLEPSDLGILQAWDVLAGARPSGRVVVADWGGDPSGLDSAEVLASDGADVVLAVGSYGVGEGLHHYRRAHYLERLYAAGVEIRHHLRLTGVNAGEVHFANTFARTVKTVIPADHLVLAQGRVPASVPEPAWGDVPTRRVGDCETPRSLEEAILEGTRAVLEIA